MATYTFSGTGTFTASAVPRPGSSTGWSIEPRSGSITLGTGGGTPPPTTAGISITSAILTGTVNDSLSSRTNLYVRVRGIYGSILSNGAFSKGCPTASLYTFADLSTPFVCEIRLEGNVGGLGTFPVGSLSLSNLLLTVTYESTPVPPGPPPPRAQNTMYYIHHPPRVTRQGDTISCRVGVSRANGATPTGSVRFTLASATAATITNAFVSGTGSVSFIDTPLNGIATGSFAFSTAGTTTDSDYNLKAAWIGHPEINPAFSPIRLSTTKKWLKFTTQPDEVEDAGDNLGDVAVQLVGPTGAVDTLFSDTVTVALADIMGTERATAQQGILTGTKQVTASSGSALFNTLAISEGGMHKLTCKVTSATYLGSTSNLISIIGSTGEEDARGLRQNTLRDGTVWRQTTGVSSPTFATVSADNLERINGDLFTTAGVNVDGFRMVFPYWMRLAKVGLKGTVTTLTNAEVEIYTTQDATAPSAGTWTQQSSFTPSRLQFQNNVEFADPITTKGLWVTLNDNGGAASANWQAIHAYGSYVNPAISFHNPVSGGFIGDEEIVSIPLPAEPLEGAQTKTREVVLRNNSDSTLSFAVTIDPARYNGDTLIDSDNISLLGTDGEPLPSYITITPRGSYPIVLQYTITAAENDESGDHLVRVTLASGSETDFSYLTVDTGGTAVYADTATGAGWFTSTTGGYSPKDTGVDQAADFVYWHMVDTTNPTDSVRIARRPINGSAATQTWTITGINTADTAHFTRAAFGNDRIILTQDDDTTCYTTTGLNTRATGSTVAATALTSFSLPAQTTGDKIIVPDFYGSYYVTNGTANASTLYKINASGTVQASQPLQSPLAGATIAGMWYDGINDEVIISTVVSGGSRKFIMLDGDDLDYIRTKTTTDRSTSEAYGGFVVAGSVIVLYGGRYLWAYDIQTFANGTELDDNGQGTTVGGAHVALR